MSLASDMGMRTQLRLVLWGMSLLWLVSIPAEAQNWSLVLNGKAFHINASKDWNEDNWGLGVEREFDSGSPWVKVAVANGFVDSADEMSYMAGGGLKRRFTPGFGSDLRVDLGVVGFVMTRQDVNNNKPFPGVLPVMTIGTPRLSVNLTYLPEAFMELETNVSRDDPTVKGVIFLQLKLSPNLLGLGARGPRN
jgi:hypothetical protein